jgi:hypothetical protein
LFFFEHQLNTTNLAHFLVKIAILDFLALAIDGDNTSSVLILSSGIGSGSLLLLSLGSLLIFTALIRVGSSSGFLRTETLLLCSSSCLLSVCLDFAESLDVLILNFEEFLRIFNCLIDCRLKEFRVIT